jgi:nucleoside-diphosphate-sugar epimerase
MIINQVTDLDIKSVYSNCNLKWDVFKDKTIYITGSTGVIGSFIIRCLLYANQEVNLNLKIVAGVRNIEKAKTFFKEFADKIEFYKNDVNNSINYPNKIDYIIHAASNTSSISFIEKPVETFNVATKGTENILNFAKAKNVESVVYLSSMEVYGNINEPKLLKENELGDLDVTDVRSSYPMGKRAAETLCYSFAKEYNIPVKVVRLAQVIGSNVAYDDTRVYAHFARSIVEKRDIVLNTKATAIISNCYITDVVAGILTVLVKGQDGACYNLANDYYSSISEVAKSLVLKYPYISVVFDLSGQNKYPPDTHWVLDNTKLKSLGWSAKVTLQEAYDRLINSFICQKV